MTRRRWMADSWSDGVAVLRGEQAHHLARVLRANPGMEFDVVADGHVWRSVIREISEAEVIFTLLSEIEADAALPLTLLLSVFKFDRMEWAIEKATELGVASIVPVIARRTEKHLAQAAAKRAERWRRIALEAAKQSRRASIPEVHDPCTLKAAVEATVPSGALRLLLAESEEDRTLGRVLARNLADRNSSSQPLFLAVGPEGGWTSDEVQFFAVHQWEAVSLGPRILRAETAAMAAMAISGAVWLERGGDESGKG